MMHHPNMHHQPMSGHPPQHMPGHQGMPPHHQMPPHQMHRENRHVALTRVGMSGGGGGGMGGHGQAMGGMGGMPVPSPHHAPMTTHHPIRPMRHPHQHPNMPPPPPQQMKPLRRVYPMNGAAVMTPQYAPPPAHPPHTGGHRSSSPVLSTPSKLTSSDFVLGTPAAPVAAAPPADVGEGNAGGEEEPELDEHDDEAPLDGEARPAAPQANSKEKTPMCLVNELARYNKIKHQYRLTSETGPPHKKVFTVTLRLGDTEEYTAEGSSIKRAQHAAASAALRGTHYPPPPPRARPPHPHPALHRHSVMPTVELNALAMKLCQPAVYTTIPPVPAPARAPRGRQAPPYRMHVPFVNTYQRMMTPGLVYRVRVAVGGRAWLGEGATPQGARHDAAARALHDLRPPETRDPPAPQSHAQPSAAEEAGGGDMLSEVKSPVSLVHELALKRNLTVIFTVKCERGPPHMRVFITAVTVGELETEGEGNGKKVSKRRAAEKMLEEMKQRWPATLLRSRPPQDKRRQQPTKKKPRNLIKEGTTGTRTESEGGADNPISRLAVARHAVRARSPQYRVVEERGAARRREFLVQCDAPPHSATGVGPNKKTAKRRAAHNVLLAMEMSTKSGDTPPVNAASPDTNNGAGDTNKPTTNGSEKRKEGESDSRQPVPGVLMMEYNRNHHNNNKGVTETNGNGTGAAAPAGAAGNNTPGAKDQLMYLSQLLGFTVQFSDFPKRNHGSYLSLVSLSTSPPVMCHGGGASTALSHEQCARAALRALTHMGLDAPPQGQNVPGTGSKPSANTITNGITE